MGRQIGRDLFLRAPGLHAVSQVFDIPGSLRGLVLLLDDQPLVSLAAILHVDDRPGSAQFLAVQTELQIAAGNLRRAPWLLRSNRRSVRTFRDPTASRCRRRTRLSECCLRNRRSRADGPQPWRRGASPTGRAMGLSGSPRTSAYRRFPAENRNGGGWRYAAG